MEATLDDRLPILVSTGLFFFVGLVLPVVRLYLTTGVFGIVAGRGADPFQVYVGRLFGLAVAASGAWAIAYGLLGPEGMGVWAWAPSARIPGWILNVGGFVLIVVAQAQMGASWRIGIDDRPTALVTSGLYRWVRNPIYTGVFLMLAGVVLLAPSPWTVMGWVTIAVIVGIQTRLEEQHLLRAHGEAFRAYAARVGRFLPGVGTLP